MDMVYSLAALVPASLKDLRQPALSPAQWLMLWLMRVWSVRLVRHAGRTNLGGRGEQQSYASWRMHFGRRWCALAAHQAGVRRSRATGSGFLSVLEAFP